MEKNYFENGDIVKLKNPHGEDFVVKIINSFCDYDGDGEMYYTVKPIDFEGFEREVKCELCYK